MSPEPNHSSQRISLSGIAFISLAVIFFIAGGVVAYFVFGSRPMDTKFAPADPTQRSSILIDDAIEMVKYYYETDSARSQTSELQYPMSIHFELDALEQYLDDVKAMKHADGVRVYFARYKKPTPRKIPNDSTGKEYDFKNHTTVIFVTTKKGEDGYPSDILSIDGARLEKLIQPYNGGISCPPLPPKFCGSGLLYQ